MNVEFKNRMRKLARGMPPPIPTSAIRRAAGAASHEAPSLAALTRRTPHSMPAVNREDVNRANILGQLGHSGGAPLHADALGHQPLAPVAAPNMQRVPATHAPAAPQAPTQQPAYRSSPLSQNDVNALNNANHQVAMAQHGRPGAQTAAPAQSAAPAAASAAQGLQRYAPHAIAAASAGALGYSAYRAGQAGAGYDRQMQDYMANARQDPGTAMPRMVYASYDEFAHEKKASLRTTKTAQQRQTPQREKVADGVYPAAHGALAQALASQLANKFIGEPIDAISGVLKKKFYIEPKQQKAFETAIAEDPMLADLNRENPKALLSSFATLKKFSPTMSQDPQASRGYLRLAATSGLHNTGPDFATIRLMAETEKNIQNSKGKGTPW